MSRFPPSRPLAYYSARVFGVPGEQGVDTGVDSVMQPLQRLGDDAV
jgi:hypothetical protein